MTAVRFAAQLVICLVMLHAADASFARSGDSKGAGKEEAAGIEYATRWDPRVGGPASAEETLKVLGLAAKHREAFDIQYFDLPLAAPASDVKRILRKRVSHGKVEWTYKYRGRSELPSTGAPCPLGVAADWKNEVDVSVFFEPVSGSAPGSSAARQPTTARGFSWSCSVKSAGAAPIPLGGVARPCSSSMRRVETEKFNIEQWTLPGGSSVIEVSMKGPDVPATAEYFFARVVGPLAKVAGFTPDSRSKTEMGSECK